MIKNLVTLIAPLLLSACASASLQVETDLYKGEVIAESGAVIDAKFNDIATEVFAIRDTAPICRDQTIAATKKIYELDVIYDKIATSVTGGTSTRTAPDNTHFKDVLDTYVQDITETSETALNNLEKIVALSDKASALSPKQQMELIEAKHHLKQNLSDINQSMEVFADVWRTDRKSLSDPNAITYANGANASKTFLDKAENAIKSLKDSEKRSLATELQNFNTKSFEVGASFTRLFATCIDIAPSTKESFNSVSSDSNADLSQSASEYARSLDAALTSLFEQPKSIKAGLSARTDIRNLAIGQGFYFEQVDRLQNPADPAWDEILMPENENNWRTTFSRTYFYAEGDSDIVIIRDRPGHFRVQRGTNNPAALVQGQLEISRSIANATTQVLSAATGVNLSLPPTSASSDTKPTAQTESSDSITIRRARIAELTPLRSKIRTAIELDIQKAILELPGSADKNAVYDRIAAQLEGYAALMQLTQESLK